MNMNPPQVMPLYSQIKEKMLAAIARGDFRAGDQLPTQRDLCQQYTASHMTVRRAIDDLVAMGVISAIPGKGLFVSEPKQETEANPLMSFSEDMARRGMKATSQVLEAELTSAPTILAKTLGVEVGSELVHLRRLRLAEGRPMALQTNTLVHTFCPGLLSHDLNQKSLYAILRNTYGLKMASHAVTAEAICASDEEARLLGIPPMSALLVCEQISYLENGRAFEFVRTAYRGDRYHLRIS
jgi:GntR family transcriptional regulator